MADSKISALSAVSGPLAAQEFPVNDAGTSKKITLAQLASYPGNGGRFNASVSGQGPGFASDTYLVGSSINIVDGSLQAKSMYRCKFNVVKTNAGTATPVINVRIGTAGTTSDTSRGTLTFSAQTAVIDEGVFEIFSTFRTVGGGTAAVLQSLGRLAHRLSITGLGVGVSEPEIATSGGFDSTVSNLIIGLSVNGGASAAWTVSLVQAELFNLV